MLNGIDIQATYLSFGYASSSCLLPKVKLVQTKQNKKGLHPRFILYICQMTVY